jgi:putative ATP-dependent endonuclease of OLD family
MQLVAFSVTNYRSITTAYKLPIKQATILIGPNNECKSNILKGLVTALEFLSSLGGIRIQRGRLRSYSRQPELYEWEKDFPISLQGDKSDGESIFNLEFRLTDEEIGEFETEVGSTLNGTLPIQLALGQKQAGFKVTKKGPGAQTLSKKAEAIAKFVAKRININYIPAVRTAASAQDIVTDLVEKELAVVEEDNAYQEALSAVAKIQQPVLDRISASIRDTLKEFLPNVKGVKVSIPPEARFKALRRSCEITVDDGTPTHLARKGDGVQSLAALSLMRHASEGTAAGRQIILAIEEPESHLHPSAIHQLRAVLADIGSKHQVIMTTHCPLFVDRTSIRSNIIVHKNRAVPAKDVRQIRDILGVRASDNLQHAELILLVEGEEDKKALSALLRQYSQALNSALLQRALGVDSLLGGSNLSYKLSQMREAMCITHCFLDHDKSGLDALKKAEMEGLVTLADATFATCDGMKDSEIEDLYDENLYSRMLLNKYGVSTMSPKFKGNLKWSDRLRETFKHQGKPWSDGIEMKVKADVSELVEANPAGALNSHRRPPIDALIQALEAKLHAIAASKH